MKREQPRSIEHLNDCERRTDNADHTFRVQTYLLSSGDDYTVKESPLCIITKSDSKIFKTNVCDGQRKSWQESASHPSPSPIWVTLKT